MISNLSISWMPIKEREQPQIVMCNLFGCVRVVNIVGVCAHTHHTIPKLERRTSKRYNLKKLKQPCMVTGQTDLSLFIREKSCLLAFKASLGYRFKGRLKL